MRGLVEYSDSEPEDEHPQAHKTAKTDEGGDTLPSLPASFLDLYSSTVRTSTRDDSSLHGGRKRVTPHIEGNWPTHVYLEWFPSQAELTVLEELVSAARRDERTTRDSTVHSLLHNDLGVALPLHISLSRPLVLRTEQKDNFQARLASSIRSGRIPTIDVAPRSLEWHPNEQFSRRFLVLRLTQPKDNQLSRLLAICNSVASEFSLPLLYADSSPSSTSSGGQDQFHISIAWALQSDDKNSSDRTNTLAANAAHRLLDADITFSAVKIRIGQDVSTILLSSRAGS